MTLHFDTHSMEFLHPKCPKKPIWTIAIVILIIAFVAWMGHNRVYETKHKYVPVKKDTIVVTVTSYQPTAEQCDSQPFLTAFMELVPQDYSNIKWVAVSQDLLDNHVNKNDTIILFTEKDNVMIGKYKVSDKMNSRKYKSVDILQDKPLKMKAKMLIQ